MGSQNHQSKIVEGFQNTWIEFLKWIPPILTFAPFAIKSFTILWNPWEQAYWSGEIRFIENISELSLIFTISTPASTGKLERT